ncbi:MAG: lytic transglycosylase domain-containing protein [Spirochaetes bacterium]|nr:lytic transglycosylase domain-containing protein [Spirochaetota bacterium]
MGAIRVFLFSFLACSCGNRLYGFTQDDFLDRVRAGDPEVFERLRSGGLARLETLGPGAFYYVARAAGALGYGELEIALLENGLERESGIAKRRCAEVLVERLSAAGDGAKTLAALDVLESLGKPRWALASLRVTALATLDPQGDVSAAVAKLRKAYPDEASRDGGALAVAAAGYELKAGLGRWKDTLRSVFARQEIPDEIFAACALILDGAPDAFEPAELARFRLRMAVAAREYQAAVVIAEASGAAFTESLPRAYLSDFARAYLYAREFERGEAVLALLEAAALKAGKKEAAFLAAFYRGRLASEAGKYPAAAGHLARAAAAAVFAPDRDVALWYLVDSRRHESAAAGFAELAARVGAWTDKYAFADLVDDQLRTALAVGDWKTVKALWDAVGVQADRRTRARLAYVAGRAVVEGGLGKDPASEAAKLFAIALAIPEADQYYRIMSAFRLGKPVFTMAERRPPRSAPVPSSQKDESASDRAERFLAGFAEFGLSFLVREEAELVLAELSDDALRRTAALCASGGHPDAWADSIRLAQKLMARPGRTLYREDHEAAWPLAFRDELAGAVGRFPVPSYLMYALMRSESFFRPQVVSRAGAVGLTQLMPSTADADAMSLSLDSWDLRRPADNILIGTYHLYGLQRATGGRFLQSLFAYNAGLGRLRSWQKGIAALPDDLFLEAIPIAETRQYGRNVLSAAVSYAALYGFTDPSAAVAELLGEER